MVHLRDRAPDVVDNGAQLTAVRSVARRIDLGDERRPLLAVTLDREGGTAPGADHRRPVLGGPLEILRVVLQPANDQHILDSARDEELRSADEAEVAAPEVRS